MTQTSAGIRSLPATRPDDPGNSELGLSELGISELGISETGLPETGGFEALAPVLALALALAVAELAG
ncbi:MAG TPA: hypothetical protein VMR14_04215 [Streptosporangiaceae bacterium]|jgi:hypothetical protein|nr:hypothetical protein [Streptosporangiaceae bacterium]